jgi:hypothetical protein
MEYVKNPKLGGWGWVGCGWRGEGGWLGEGGWGVGDGVRVRVRVKRTPSPTHSHPHPYPHQHPHPHPHTPTHILTHTHPHPHFSLFSIPSVIYTCSLECAVFFSLYLFTSFNKNK